MEIDIVDKNDKSTPIIPDIPSTGSELQHSEEGYVSYFRAQKRIERLKSNIQRDRKPYRVLELGTYEPDSTGLKSLDEIVLTGESSGFLNSKNNMDCIDCTYSSTPERIVRVETEVEGAPVRGSSAHGVLFLSLGTQRGELLDVAVKAFPKPSHALAEYINTQTIKERGIDTLEPVAVILEGSGQKKKTGQEDESIGYYISAMEPIRSLDRLRVLRKGYLEIIGGEEHEQLYLRYLGMIGREMANMHLKGIFPRDSQIKNFAIREDGSLIPIDFENTNIYNEDLYLTNPERFIEAAFRGISVLFGSLNNEGNPKIDFYAGFSGENLWEIFNNTIFSAYTSAFEDKIMRLAENEKISVDQFTQSLDTIDLIREKIREKIITPVNSSHQ